MKALYWPIERKKRLIFMQLIEVTFTKYIPHWVAQASHEVFGPQQNDFYHMDHRHPSTSIQNHPKWMEFLLFTLEKQPTSIIESLQILDWNSFQILFALPVRWWYHSNPFWFLKRTKKRQMGERIFLVWFQVALVMIKSLFKFKFLWI